MLFASLELEREPLTLSSFWDGGGLESWVQTVGVVFGLGVLIFMILRAIGWRPQIEKTPPRWMPLFWLVGLCMLLAYAGVIVLALIAVGSKDGVSAGMTQTLRALFTLAGVLAIIAATMDFWINAVKLRWRRIWALALLSIKEAVRRKVLYVFGFFLIIYLFATWFVPYKPADQLKNNVVLVFFAMPILVLVCAGLVSAFSIPNDIKNQNIHTIVTKPVERFEIVLGRFIGYSLLMTVVLFVLTTLSLGYVLRGVNNPDAAAESLKARQPLYGTLTYESTNEQGITRPLNPENVGREWDYRGYVGGPTRGRPTHYAVWSYDQVPAKLGERDKVPVEFYLDIYRTTKGEENRGVNCTFLFETWRTRPITAQEYARDDRRFQPTKINELVEEYGYYEVQSKQIFDYRTDGFEVPGALFKSQNISRAELQALVKKYEGRVAEVRKQRADLLAELEPLQKKQDQVALSWASGGLAAGALNAQGAIPAQLTADDAAALESLEIRRSKIERDLATVEEQLKYATEDDKTLEGLEKDGKPRPPLKVRVRCNTPNQFVGMAKYDLYFRADDAGPTDTLGFSLNFYKGALGVWLQLLLVVGLSVFLSTELGGVISVLLAGLLYIAGLPGVRTFIEEIAIGKNVGGGPLEAFFRLAKRENISAPLEESTTTNVATWSDDVIRWILRRVMNILPEVGRFDFTEHVGKGFDIVLWQQDLLPGFILLIGYLFPWAVISYYLIKIREIAGAH